MQYCFACSIGVQYVKTSTIFYYFTGVCVDWSDNWVKAWKTYVIYVDVDVTTSTAP